MMGLAVEPEKWLCFPKTMLFKERNFELFREKIIRNFSY